MTSLELFFDLVFVFAITQLTDLLLTSRGLNGYGHAALVLALSWWMYDGYAWLTNNVGPTSVSTRLPILVAMAGFLVMAISTPDAFGSGRWLFAIAYPTTLAIWGYSVSHLLHIAGLVLLAAALHVAVNVPGHGLGTKMAVTMASETALFLLGEVLFERRLRLGSGLRTVAAACCAGPALVGLAAPAVVELTLLTMLVAGLVGVREAFGSGADEQTGMSVA